MNLLLAFLLAGLSACCAHISGRVPSQDLESHFYCGRRLARMLATVCDYDVKRSGSGSMMHHILAPYYEAQEQRWPLESSQRLKNQESNASPHKMDFPANWPQKTDSEYTRPLTGSYGLFYHKSQVEDWPARKSQDGEAWPLLTPSKARGLDMPSRNKRYVVSECCEKACTVEELTSYC